MDIANFTQIEFNNKYEEIYKSAISGIKSEIHPKAYILGGQPGAGKSRLNQHIKYFNDNNVAIINGDEYRKYHPHFREILDYYGDDFPKYTSEFSSRITQRLIEDLSDKKYNLSIEGTLRTSSVPLNTCRILKEKNYNVSLYIMATKDKISYLSTQLRYYNFKSKKMVSRATPKEHHDMVFNSICTNLNEIEKSKKFDNICIFDRQLNIIYDSVVEDTSATEKLSNFYKKDYSKYEIDSINGIINQLLEYTNKDFSEYVIPKLQEKVKQQYPENVRPSMIRRLKEKHNILNSDKKLDKAIDEKDQDKLKTNYENER